MKRTAQRTWGLRAPSTKDTSFPTGLTPVQTCPALPLTLEPTRTEAIATRIAEQRLANHTSKPFHRSPLGDSNAHGSTRNGFSLIEVILATAILLGSVFVLSELANIGRRQSQRADLQSQAQELCERTLNEILTGEREPVDVDNEPLLPPDADQTDLGDLSEPIIDEDEELLIFETPEEKALLATGGELTESDWLYSVRVVPLPDMPGLAAVTVSVKQSDEQLKRPVRFSLTRWLEAPSTLENNTDSFEPASPDFGFSLGADR